MIRTLQEKDIDRVAQIWLDTNILAHNFIAETYWKKHFPWVKEMFFQTEMYVYEEENTSEIQGFIGVNHEDIAGIFVWSEAQSGGIGKQLLDFVKKRKKQLRLSVYQQNIRAITFYLREGFTVQEEGTEEATGEKEYRMIWKGMRYYLAPMEGITGYVFRNAYHRCFPGMDKYFSPFLSPNQDGKLSPREYEDLAPEHNQGIKLIPQIMTNCAADFIRTAKTLNAMGYDEVNFNLGCPSGTVVAKGKGSGFLAFPEKLDRCLDELFSGLDMKISIKTRLGKTQPEEFIRLLTIYNQYPLEELIIHPRIQKDGYKNTPNLQMFSYAYEHSAHPLCYNGDIFTIRDGWNIEEKFPKLPAIMLGRGMVKNPGLLAGLQAEIPSVDAQDFTVNYASDKHGIQREKERLREFHDDLFETYCSVYLRTSGPKVVLFKMKEIWCYLASSFETADKAVKKIKKAQNLNEYQTAVSLMFANAVHTEKT